MIKLEKSLEEYLSSRYQWIGNSLVKEDKLLKMYSNSKYTPSKNLINFLLLFYNCSFVFCNPKHNVTVDFKVKKVLKDYPYEFFYEQLKKRLNVNEVIPFGELFDGHMVLVADENENIYGVYEETVIKLGNDYSEMLYSLYCGSY